MHEGRASLLSAFSIKFQKHTATWFYLFNLATSKGKGYQIRNTIWSCPKRNNLAWIFMSSILIGYRFLYSITHWKSIQSLIPKGCYFNAFMELFSLISIYTEKVVTKIGFWQANIVYNQVIQVKRPKAHAYMPPFLHQLLIIGLSYLCFHIFHWNVFFNRMWDI